MNCPKCNKEMVFDGGWGEDRCKECDNVKVVTEKAAKPVVKKGKKK